DFAWWHVWKAVRQPHLGQAVLEAHTQQLDLVDAFDQAFEIQEADHQRPQLPGRAHQRDQLAVLDENAEADLADDARVNRLGLVARKANVLARHDGRERRVQLLVRGDHSQASSGRPSSMRNGSWLTSVAC